MISNTVIEAGTLYIVATPIGNMSDMSVRGIETLTQVDLIYAEDTRQTHKLLQQFGIQNTVYQLHKHNEASQKHDIANQLSAGKSVAIVSDAGTPLIADPGYVTLSHLRERAHRILVVPGCSSVIAGLSISGLPSNRFQFAGFIPSKPKQRQTFLSQYLFADQTTIFFETPHRIKACLDDCLTIFGGTRQLFIGRELTKQFEDSVLLPLSEAPTWINAHNKREKGEFTLALAPTENQSEEDWQGLTRLLIETGVSTKTATSIVTEYTGRPKKSVYQFALSLGITP